MKNRMLIGLLAVSMTAAMLGGCGNETTDDGAGQTQQTEVSGDNAVTGDNTETEAVEVEVPVTAWVEEHGITFTEGEVSIPAYGYATDTDGNIMDGIIVVQQDAVYSEPVIEVSEPDADGYVTYTITYTLGGNWTGTMPLSIAEADWIYGVQYNLFGLLDAYTGTVFPSADLDMTGGKDAEYMVEADVEIDGNVYHVSKGAHSEDSFEWIGWTQLSSAEYQGDASYDVTVTQYVVVPQEYDGLVLYISSTANTGEEMDSEVSEAEPFDVEDIPTTIFKNVNYEGSLLK